MPPSIPFNDEIKELSRGFLVQSITGGWHIACKQCQQDWTITKVHADRPILHSSFVFELLDHEDMHDPERKVLGD